MLNICTDGSDAALPMPLDSLAFSLCFRIPKYHRAFYLPSLHFHLFLSDAATLLSRSVT